MLKKWLPCAILLAALLVFCIGAQAEPSISSSGTCGSKLQWKLDSAGTLTISGSGEMENYVSYDSFDTTTNSPWDSACDSIQRVVIESGVSSIGDYAFFECVNLTSVSIPDSINSIGSSAFRDCTGLTSARLPDGLTSIGGSAFRGCTGLTSINLPNGVRAIREYAFYGCSLTSVDLPDGVTSIGEEAFSNCTRLTSVHIPDGVTSIGSFAFESCSSLNTVYADSLAGWLSIAFEGHASNPLSRNGGSLYIGNELLTEAVIPDGVTSIGDRSFWSCTSLTSVILPDGVTSIGESAFESCTNLTSILLPDSLRSIGFRAFYDCASLTDISIPDGVTSIGDHAFEGCDRLTSIVASGTCGSNLQWKLDSAGTLTISGSGEMKNYYSYLNSPWHSNQSSIQKVIIENGVTSIGNYAFYDCTSLTNINIPDSVTSIGDSAFTYCDALTSITLPDGVNSISDNAFLGCESLTGITLPDSVTSIGVGSFYWCSSLISIKIPNSVTSIGNSTFYKCSSLTSITLPDSVNSIGNGAFYGCSSLTSITLPDGVTFIGDHAFEYCSSLTSISIPDSVTSIVDRAFYNCSNLKQLVFLGQDTLSLGEDLLSHSYYPTYNPTIYCYEYSEVDFWATNQGYEIVYLDGMDLSIPWSLTLPEDRWLEVGESIRIQADIFLAQKNPEITWVSSDPAIVSVEDGLLTAHAAGDATITADCKGVQDSIDIHAYIAAESFDLSESEIWIPSKTSYQLRAQNLLPEDAEEYFTWTSSDTSILKVDPSGLISALAPGDARVTVTSDRGITRECLVHVCYPVTAIAFEPAEMELVSGESTLLHAKVSTRTQEYVNRMVEFASSDSSVVSVNASGKITAHARGEASITATAQNGISAVCQITVAELEQMVLPKSLKQIETEAFIGAPIQDVALPDGVVEIGARAFAGCVDLQIVRMPDSVTSIAEDAFDGCEQLRFICASENAAAAYAQAHGIFYSIP